MTWMRAARLPAVALVLVVGGCGGATSYSFSNTPNEHDSVIKVDTSQLHALKATTGIQPCPASSVGTEALPGGLPDVTLPCLGGGRSVDLAGLRGPLMLNFWGQFCGPCREESPLLQKFAASAHGRVRVMGVDFEDARPDLAIEFAKELGLTYPQLADPEAATRAALHISGLPMTLFVDASGRLTYTQVGAITSEQQLAQLVRDHLGVPVPAGWGS